MKIVAVTGASGFIGRHLIPLLLQRGDTVRVFDRGSHPSAFSSDVQAFPGDVTDAAAVSQLVSGADTVIHLAGVAHTSLDTEADRQRARDVNVGGPRNVLESARKSGVRRVVIASSAHVYEGQCGVGVREDAPQGAEILYAQTKIETEILARQMSSNGMEVVIGRPCLTYGPNAGFNLLKLMRAIDKGYYFHIRSRRVTRSFGSVYTAARAFAYLAEKGIPGEAYNIADRHPMDLSDFVNNLASSMKRHRPMSVPYALLWSGAAGCSLFKLIGKNGPISFEALSKLTQSFAISTDKLASAGFEWLAKDAERARKDMVNVYLIGAR